MIPMYSARPGHARRFPLTLGALAIVSAVLLAAMPASAVSETQDAEADSEIVAATVDIQDFLFRPNDVTIPIGGVVEWINLDAAAHTAAGPGFDTGRLSQGESRRISFPTAGRFGYNCGFHANMAGAIVVE